MFVRQLFDKDTFTYTYLVADLATREAAIVDPVKEQLERDSRLIEELGLSLKYVLETHVHADHITSAAQLRDRFGAKVVLHEASQAPCADLLVQDQSVLTLGAQKIVVLHTPGHTNADISFEIDGAVFTGDALFVRGSGRTDFQAGDSSTLYRSIHGKLFTLADETIVYPGHDYRGHTSSTIGEEKRHNPRVGAGRDLAAFVAIMDELNLPNPARIDVSLPGNMRCGQELSA